MKCIYCNYEIEDSDVCPVCGRSLRVYRRILAASDICYNRALQKANTRNLSGAIRDLKEALRFNKYNINARNLLALIYFETGRAVDALSEWVISKNFSPFENLADYFLSRVQGDSAMLNKIDNATKKYNQSIAYIRQDDLDLATIQLRRLVAKNPKMLDARCLLALLYMKDQNYSHARKELAQAAKIDNGNPIINTYIKELAALQLAGTDGSHKRRKRSNLSEDGQNINEGGSRVSYLMDYSKVSVVNIIIGCILGLLISMFLILPAIRQMDNDNTMSAVISANEEARSNENNLSNLREEIETLKSALGNYEGKPDIKESYDNLFLTQRQMTTGDMDAATATFANIGRDLLDTNGQQTYDELAVEINNHVATRNYAIAAEQMRAENYPAAINAYLSVVAIDEGYDGGNALLNLATCYENMGDNASATSYYQRLAEILPDTRPGRAAAQKVNLLDEEAREN